MRKVIFLMLLAFVGVSCSKKEDNKEEESPKNPLIGTKWTTVDDIAEIIYGKTCTTSIEFLDATRCQTIDVRKTRFGAGTDIVEGVYEIKGDSVFWSNRENDKKLNMRGKVSGSVIITRMRTTSLKNRTYTKE